MRSRGILLILALAVWLPSGAAQDLTKLAGHEDTIYAVDYTPDGKLLLTGSFDQTVKVWNRETKAAIRTITDHKELVLTVEVSPDGRRFASSGLDRSIKLYDVPQLDPIYELKDQPQEGKTLALSYDGEWLVSGDKDRVRLWQTKENKHVHDWKELSAEAQSVDISRNNELIVAGAKDGQIRGWNRNDKKLVGTLYVPSLTKLLIHPNNRTILAAGEDGAVRVTQNLPPEYREFPQASNDLHDVDVAPNGQWIATASEDKHVRWYQISDQKQVRDLDHEQPVLAVAFNRNSQEIATAGKEGWLKLWQTSDGKRVSRWKAHENNVRCVKYHPNNQQLATAADDGTIRLWQLPPSEVRESKPHNAAIRELALSHDGRFLATASEDKSVKLFQTSDGKEIKSLGGFENNVTCVDVARNNSQIAAGGDDQKVRIFNTNGQAGPVIEGHGSPIRAVAFHPNSQEVASGGTNKQIKLWKVGDGSEIRTLEGHDGEIVALEYLPNGSLLVSAADRTVRFWQMPNGNVQKLDVGSNLTCMALSPDGKLVAVGSEDRQIRVYQVSDRKQIATFEGHSQSVTALHFSNDNKRLLSTANDKTARLWEIETQQHLQTIPLPNNSRGVALAHDGKIALVGLDDGKLLLEPTPILQVLREHEGPVNAVAFNSNGSHLASAGKDKKVRLWNIGNAKVERSFPGAENDLYCVAISGNNQYVAAGGQDKKVHVWQFNDAKNVQTVELNAAVRGVAFSSDHRRVAFGSDDQLAGVLEIESGVVLEHFRPHEGNVVAVEFTPDGKQLVTAGTDDRARLFTPVVERGAKLHEESIRDLAWYANGSQFATCSTDNQLALWNEGDFRELRKYSDIRDDLYAVAVADNNSALAAGGKSDYLKVFHPGNGQLRAEVKTPADVLGLATDRDGKNFAVLGSDQVIRNYGLVRVNNQEQLQLVQEFRGHNAELRDLALAQSGEFLYTSGADRTIRQWSIAGAEPVRELNGHGSHVYSLAFSPDGQKLASASADKSVKLWNLEDGKNYATCQGHESQVYGVDWHPDGKRLISCGADATIRWWEATGKTGPQLKEGIDDGLYSVLFDKKGERFVTGGLNKQWLLYRVGNSQPDKMISGHNDYIYRAVFNPAGTRIATIGYSGSLFIWDANSGEQVYYQQLPVQAAFSLCYAPSGEEIAIASQNDRNEVVILKVPGNAR